MPKITSLRPSHLFPAAVSTAMAAAIVAAVTLGACGHSKRPLVPSGGAGGGAGTLAGHPGHGGGAGSSTAGEAGTAGQRGGAAGRGASDGGAGHGGGGAAGGAHGTPVEPYFHAGTRLKPRVFRVGDVEVIDESQEGGWYDTETRDWCDFRFAADGVERCLPFERFTDDPSVIHYLDPACTRPAVTADTFYCDPSAVAPRSITAVPDAGCGYRAYRIGDRLPYGTPLYDKNGASCHPIQPPEGGADLWPLEEEVPLSTFVAMRRVTRPRHPQMNALVREGDDGSWQVMGFSDPTSGRACSGLGLDVAPSACVPDWADASAEGFSDASCTQHVGWDRTPECAPARASVLLELSKNPSSCPPTSAITGVWQSTGERLTQVFNTSNADGVCEAAPGDPSLLHGQGAPMDLASLAKLDVIEVGSGPLTVAFYGFAGVPFLPAPPRFDPEEASSSSLLLRFTDVARSEPCVPSRFADGRWRCVPSSFDVIPNAKLYYTSADCMGARVYDVRKGIPVNTVGAVCRDPTRSPRGLIVRTGRNQQCDMGAVMATLALDGPSTTGAVYLSDPTGTLCGPLTVSPVENLITASTTLNPDEVFVTMERVLHE